MTKYKAVPYLFLAVLCTVLFFSSLGKTPLIGLDEALYAEASREMLESGNYIVPTYNGRPFFDKPPLGYWLQATSIKIFGATSFAVRLPSAIAATALVFATVLAGTWLYSTETGLFAGFVLATAVYTLPLARLCSLDQLFTLSITLALTGFAMAYLSRCNWYYVLLWIATGISILTKGPAGGVVVLAVIGIYVLARRLWGVVSHVTETHRARTRNYVPHVLGLVLFVLITVPWYALVQRETSGAFLREFLLHQNLQRAMGADFHHNMPFWFYLPIYMAGFFPWSVFIPSALATHVRLRPTNRTEEASLLMATWIVAVIGVFSVSRSKLPNYIYPAYPPSALLVGLLWSKTSTRRAAGALLAVAVVLGIALIAGPIFLPKTVPGLPTALIPMAISIVLGSAFSAIMMRNNRRAAAFAGLCCGMIGFALSAALIGLPIAARTMADPAALLGRKIRRVSSPNDKVIAYLLPSRLSSLPFYAQRPVTSAHSPQELKEAINAPGNCLVIVQEEDFAALPQEGRRVISRIGSYILCSFSE